MATLKLVKYQDWSAEFAYAPPLVDATINLDEVVSVTPCDSRGEGPFVRVKLTTGDSLICRGVPADFAG